MCKFRSTLKTRQMRRALSRLGCRCLRQSGSHESWETPKGTRLPVLLRNEDELRDRIAKAVLTALIAEGLMPAGSDIRSLRDV